MNLSAGDPIQMSSPYQVSPPQGGLLGSIMDFIGANRQLQLDAGTRNQINGQQGYGSNVDPFQMQKYAGEGQRQQIAGDMNTRAATEQNWQGADRTSQQNTMGQLSQNPAIAGDPILSALTGNAGANPMLGQTIMGMLTGDRRNEQATTGYGVQNAYSMQQDALKHNYALDEINAQISGKGTGAGGARGEKDARLELARRKYAETGNREDLLALGGYDEQAQTMRDDYLFNQNKKHEQEAANAILQQRQNGAKPQEAVKVGAQDAGATFMTAQPAPPEVLRTVGGAVQNSNPGATLAEYINNLLGIKGGRF